MFAWAGEREPLAPELGEALDDSYPPTCHGEGRSAMCAGSIWGEDAAAGRAAER